MNVRLASVFAIVLFHSGQLYQSHKSFDAARNSQAKNNSLSQHSNSWTFFLQHLEIKDAPVVDYRGRVVPDYRKAAGILSYDVGNKDLQQCADALMRLRAEYLYSQKRFHEIGFHFVSGYYYTWSEYCKGRRPKATGNTVKIIQGKPEAFTHQSLRNYLDIVYTYASTISLSKELKNTSAFEIGTVVIHPGSPGHCFIIIDEKTVDGVKFFKLAEGYTPAQSIYVLKNLSGDSEWYALKKGVIETTSYVFDKYEMKRFE